KDRTESFGDYFPCRKENCIQAYKHHYDLAAPVMFHYADSNKMMESLQRSNFELMVMLIGHYKLGFYR
ncbi:MAG: hypothetical protein L0H53_15340, partial [Candidatus Nitrosocosmicus sp.]|nr:hypothetical protein [Candidatus Nitrosocosmicus sp.]